MRLSEKDAAAVRIILLGTLSLLPYAVSFSIAGRESIPICPSAYQLCTSSSVQDFCCPSDMVCGSTACLPRVETVTTTIKSHKSTITVRETHTRTPTPSPTTSQQKASTTASPTPTSTASASSPGFFTTKVIVIFAASGAGLLIVLCTISFFCYRARKRGRELAAAYENPEREPYTPVYVAPKAKSVKSARSSHNVIIKETGVSSPLTPAFDIDVNSPSSPAFPMTPQAPAGPLGSGSNNNYYQTGHFLNPAYTDPNYAATVHPAYRGGTMSPELERNGVGMPPQDVGLYTRPEPEYMIPPRSTSLERPLVSPASPVGRVMFSEVEGPRLPPQLQVGPGAGGSLGGHRYLSPPPTHSTPSPVPGPWENEEYWHERR